MNYIRSNPEPKNIGIALIGSSPVLLFYREYAVIMSFDYEYDFITVSKVRNEEELPDISHLIY